jgi:hypothetical protein
MDSATGTIDLQPECIFYSDRGSNLLGNRHGEKNNWINRMIFITRTEARQEVFKLIEGSGKFGTPHLFVARR